MANPHQPSSQSPQQQGSPLGDDTAREQQGPQRCFPQQQQQQRRESQLEREQQMSQQFQ